MIIYVKVEPTDTSEASLVGMGSGPPAIAALPSAPAAPVPPVRTASTTRKPLHGRPAKRKIVLRDIACFFEQNPRIAQPDVVYDTFLKAR